MEKDKKKIDVHGFGFVMRLVKRLVAAGPDAFEPSTWRQIQALHEHEQGYVDGELAHIERSHRTEAARFVPGSKTSEQLLGRLKATLFGMERQLNPQVSCDECGTAPGICILGHIAECGCDEGNKFRAEHTPPADPDASLAFTHVAQMGAEQTKAAWATWDARSRIKREDGDIDPVQALADMTEEAKKQHEVIGSTLGRIVKGLADAGLPVDATRATATEVKA